MNFMVDYPLDYMQYEYRTQPTGIYRKGEEYQHLTDSVDQFGSGETRLAPLQDQKIITKAANSRVIVDRGVYRMKVKTIVI